MKCSWCNAETHNDTALCSTTCAFRMRSVLESRLDRIIKEGKAGDKPIIKEYREKIKEIDEQYKGVIAPCLD